MAEVFNKNFDNLQQIFAEILKIKNAAAVTDRKHDDLAEKRKYASLLFVLLKKLNRLVKYRVRSGREQLHNAKVNVDSNRLHLQNLLYEVNHLKREVRYCHQFKSQDEDIDLLPESEFLAVVRPELPNSSEHTKRLGRLEWELSLRKQKAAYYNELLNSKKQVVQDSVLKTERLTSLVPSLRSLYKATKPLQDALQIPMDREWKLSQLVQLLPQPLYLAYMNIHALELLVELELHVSVIGGEQEVHNNDLAQQKQQVRRSVRHNNDDGDADFRKPHAASEEDTSDSMPERQNRTLAAHPLIVRFTIGNEQTPNECLTIDLRYFQHLGFITAASIMNLNESDGAMGEVGSSQDILKYLYEMDIGDIVPVAKAQHELKKTNMSSLECLDYLSEKQLGRPYCWLQRMCGIEIFNEFKANTTNDAKAQQQQQRSNIPEIIKSIQNLWHSRLNLIKQLKSLINKNTSLYLKDESLPSMRAACSLAQWTSVDWEEYAANSSTATYIEQQLVDASQFFFRAVVVRGSAKMECLISISSKFPADSPLWVICIYWNGQHDATNSAAIKLMEQWTNNLMQCQLENPLALLSSQLLRTMYSFDIFLETEGPLYTPVEYNREKHYIKAFAKRIRAQPYRYIKGGTINSFKQ